MLQLSERELARLSPQERLNLIERLWESLVDSDVPVTAEQKEELERRLSDFQSDSTQAVTWEELRADLLKRSP
jgi:putative addiction module component (TIGR02574 family)